MSKDRSSDEELLALMAGALAEDVLSDAYPSEDVADEIRRGGGDPGAIGERGAVLARRLIDERRLAWRERARRWQEHVRATMRSLSDRLQKLPPAELRRKYEEEIQDPKIALAFHKHRGENASPEELRHILEEIAMARTLQQADAEFDDDGEDEDDDPEADP